MTIDVEAEQALIAAQPEITKDLAVRFLTELAAERPDHIDPDSAGGHLCQYVRDGKPSCLVGNVAIRAGWTVEALSLADRSANVWLAEQQMFGPQDSAGWNLLKNAQAAQDAGSTWSDSVLVALLSVAE